MTEHIPAIETDKKLNQCFPGRVVRKDLTKKLKGSNNVPVYVLEYLLGSNCATEDEELIEEGVKKVKRILSDNYVRPDEAELIKSRIRETGYYTVIDKITVHLNERRDVYEAEFSSLGIKEIEIDPETVKKYEKLLGGGIWCIVKMEYSVESSRSPFMISSLKPIQIPNMDINELIDRRKKFTKDEWIDILLRTIGMEPDRLEYPVKWHLLERLVPLVENNYNLCELGPRSTGKSHVYKEISPNSILISGGQTTVANLFYNLSSRQVGLVGLWDVVAFDEVAGIRFKDKDGIQILKDYMASGSFARGKDQINANASIVFVGNVNQSISSLMKTAHLFAPFPDVMNNDSAFFDRIHYYLPGWEVPKFRPEHFTEGYGFIVDYLAEFLREMRKRSFGDHIFKYFRFGNNLNQRDVIAVKKTFSGLMKLLYPDDSATKEDAREILEYALTGRRRVKEQLKKIGGIEFYDVNFSYIDVEEHSEHFVTVPESGGSRLIPEGMGKPGQVFSVNRNEDGKIGVYKFELQVVAGSGKYEKSGLGSNSKAKEAVQTAFNYFKANAKSVSQSISTKEKDYQLHVQDLTGVGIADGLALPAFISLCSGALEKPVHEQIVILGTFTIGGSISVIDNLSDLLQVCLDAGAKKVLIPISSAGKISMVPPDLFSKFQISFYEDPVDAVYKSLALS
ncbi:protease Lon-related BREX system protein BrxL [Methanomicrobium antiquum]|uniref:Protease Lon-related BREX system protein BrxL n=1 Tax=Methanomicrobium antiquum TaxID=487686 RepID=A0AAF0FRK8_9EURY|nr:protease Lon-related BREX system protein BrxL [Methanomicrobium antiquum]MDD4127272.1 protease Lon-related BREX system protein BrxL [Methanomicrobium sp.]WFN37262.1 protease Lon-related BREX system protein BrxL [Methanomicrobium antiquum]